MREEEYQQIQAALRVRANEDLMQISQIAQVESQRRAEFWTRIGQAVSLQELAGLSTEDIMELRQWCETAMDKSAASAKTQGAAVPMAPQAQYGPLHNGLR